MLEDQNTLLSLDYKQGQNKQCSILELLQLKETNGTTDKGFNDILRLIKTFFLEGNKLPSSTYKAKEVVCPFGLEVQKIYACPNECILYRGEENKKLQVFLVCKESRYKVRHDHPFDVEGEPLEKEYLLKSYDTFL